MSGVKIREYLAAADDQTEQGIQFTELAICPKAFALQLPNGFPPLALFLLSLRRSGRLLSKSTW